MYLPHEIMQGCNAKMWLSLLILNCFYATPDSTSSQEQLHKMTFKPPVLSEEEQRSAHLPDHLRCDACRAVANQLTEEFTRATGKLKSSRPLKESEVLDLSDKLCRTGFHNYGIKGVDGVNRLSGPGLSAQDVAGVVQMGGKWPKRLQDLCSLLIGEVGEDEIYAVFRGDPESLYPFLCTGDSLVQASCKNTNQMTKITDEF